MAVEKGAQWYRIRFFPEEVKAGEHRRLRNDMLRLYNQRGRPEGVALYSTRVQRNGSIYLFFSPAAYQAFKRAVHLRRIRPAVRPDAGSVTVVLGDRTKSAALLD